MKLDFMNNVGRTLSKTGLKIKAHSPEILVVMGVVGVVASAVMACKATTKVNTVLDKTKDDLDKIHAADADGYVIDASTGEVIEYTVEDRKKATAIVYAKTGLEFIKLYGPSVALGTLSIGCMLTSNTILHKRNVALAAAYATIENGFKEYRGRVIERFGKDLDRELKYNIKSKTVSEMLLDEAGNPVVDENGEVKTVEKNVQVGTINEHSEYARFFDEWCTGWQKDAELNLYFLRQQQNYANELLRAKGYVFLNQVYDMLGIKRTKAGQIVGWVYDETGRYSDGHIDFGIYDLYNEKARDFVNGRERSILLEFNVDGNILDKI